MIDKYSLAIGKAMRYQRTLKRLSLQQVADKIGLAKNTVAYYEKGKISISVNNLKNTVTLSGSTMWICSMPLKTP